MADRIIKSDSGNDTVIQNNSGSRKIEITDSGNIEFVGDLGFTGDTDSKFKLPSAGGIFESNGSTEILTESGGSVSLKNTAIDSTVTMSANQSAVKTALNASGSAPIYAVRAWANVNSDLSLIGAGNVSSVTISGSNLLVNFTTDLPNDDYAVIGTATTNANNNVVQRDSVATDKTVSKCTLSVFNINAQSYVTNDVVQVVIVG